MTHRMYEDLAEWWPLLSPPEEYIEEASAYREAISLPLVQRGAFDPRNFVKKAVNCALRNIGKRNLVLNAAAMDCAEKCLALLCGRLGSESVYVAEREARLP